MCLRPFLIALLVCGSASAQTPVRLRVDATDVTRRLVHVRMTMPAKAGPMTLLYPEWIPGEHGPTGPIANLVGLKIEGGGRSIPWKRDDVDTMVQFSPLIELTTGPPA